MCKLLQRLWRKWKIKTKEPVRWYSRTGEVNQQATTNQQARTHLWWPTLDGVLVVITQWIVFLRIQYKHHHTCSAENFSNFRMEVPSFPPTCWWFLPVSILSMYSLQCKFWLSMKQNQNKAQIAIKCWLLFTYSMCCVFWSSSMVQNVGHFMFKSTLFFGYNFLFHLLSSYSLWKNSQIKKKRIQ